MSGNGRIDRRQYIIMKKVSAFITENKDKIFFWISVALAAETMVLCIYYALFPSRGYFHSDCTDSLFWAAAALRSGRMLSKTFVYSAILPFGGQQIFEIFIALFGVTMKAQVLSMAVFIIVFSAGIVFLMRSASFRYTDAFFTLAALLMTLASSDKLREIFFSHVIYYSLSICLLSFFAGLLLRFIKAGPFIRGEAHNKKKSIIYGILAGVFAMCMAFNGFQILILTLVPAAGAVFCIEFCDQDSRLMSDKSRNSWRVIIVLCLACLIGIMYRATVYHGITAAYEDAYTVSSVLSSWSDHIKVYMEQYLSLIGAVDSTASLMSVVPVKNLFISLVALIFNVLPLGAFLFYKRIKHDGVKLMLWINLFVSFVIMFGYICGALSAANWRLSPMLCTQVLAVCAVVYELFAGRAVARRFACVFTALIAVFSLMSANTVRKMPADYGRDNALYTAADALERHGLTKGYATFWNAAALTVISDSKVQMEPVNIDDNGMTKYVYQCENNAFDTVSDDDTYFLMMTQTEYASFNGLGVSLTLDNFLTDQFTCGNYIVLVYSANPADFI